MGSHPINRFACLVTFLAIPLVMAGCQLTSLSLSNEDTVDGQTSSAQQEENALVILNDTDLPDTSPRTGYLVHLSARGGVLPLHWRVEKGALPPGIQLDDNGVLHGAAERNGEFQFTASVTDSGSPRQSVQKQFIIRVRSALMLNWKNQARVNGNRIEGSVEVTNTTPDDIDLTFIVLAVASNGRATAIGYQHFVLPRSTTAKELPFGDTLPYGGYVVHVDAVGEVPPKNLIYRERMETPGPLKVTVGP
jgi:Putative Ig domain